MRAHACTHTHAIRRCMQCSLPYRDYKLWRKADNHVMFSFVAKKLMEGDLQFFRDKAVEENIMFYIQVRVGYSFTHSLTNSIDLGTSPQFYRVEPSQLSASQQAYLQQTKRKLHKETPKLCSLHSDDGTISDFADGLLYFTMFHSVIIREVLTIVQCKSANFMTDYMESLGERRSASSSNVESKLMKALGR